MENIVKVIVRDEKEFQAVAHLVDAFAEVQYLGIEFEHSEKEGLSIQLTLLAFGNSPFPVSVPKGHTKPAQRFVSF